MIEAQFKQHAYFRKIDSSYYTILHPAEPASFVQILNSVPVVKARAAAKIHKETEQSAGYNAVQS